MLYVGGVSFFALLAIFPGLTLVVAVYGLLTTPEHAATQAAAFSSVLPPAAQTLIHDEVHKIVKASVKALSLQSAFSLLVGAYAAHRGVKALLAGLQFIYAERRPRSVFEFNLMALIVGVAAFVIITVASFGFVAFKLVTTSLHLVPLKQSLLSNVWTWAWACLTVGLSLLYRYAMASHPVSIRAAGSAGAIAAILTLAASYLSAVYVTQVVNMGAAYGSIGAVIVFLIWLSWNVNVVLFGAALATEIEMALGEGEASHLAYTKPKLTLVHFKAK
jgi:membrane protein